MAFQFASSRQYTTVAADTRLILLEAIKTVLLGQGWTEAAGSVAGSRKLLSVVTAQGLQLYLILFDPGSGSLVLALRDTALTVQSQNFYLLPAAGKVFQILANPHQCFIWKLGSLVAREFFCCGCPYLEAFLTTGATAITQLIWAHGNAAADTTTVSDSFRVRLSLKSSAAHWQMINTVAWGAAGGIGAPKLETIIRAYAGVNDPQGPVYWHDDIPVKIPARIAFGSTAGTDPAKIRGQLWDAAVIMQDFAMDYVPSPFEDYNWINITNNNITGRGNPSLFLATSHI